MLINGWDGKAQAWGKIAIHLGMQVGHNMDLGIFRVIGWNEETETVRVERTENPGIYSPPLPLRATYHIGELMAV